MLNEVFSLLLVASDKHKSDGGRSIDIALKLAKAKGWNQSEFARRMTLAGENPVSPGAFSNWKRRGMPPEHIETASRVLGCSADELLGREVTASPGINGGSDNKVVRLRLRQKLMFPVELFDKLPDIAKGEIIGTIKEKAHQLEIQANRGKRKQRS